MSASEHDGFGPNLSAVFLDRDGVINEKMPEGRYVTNWTEFRLIPGVTRAIERLNRARIPVLIVSNQRGVSLGLYTVEDVNRIHEHFQDRLAESGAHIDGFFFCPHGKEVCGCRKPSSGLYWQAKAMFPDIEARTSVMIGDSLSDIQFGTSLGMQTIFIKGDIQTQKPGWEMAARAATVSAASLDHAVSIILKETTL